MSGDFLFFEHIHPDKEPKNKLQFRNANLGRIELSSPSSYGDTREKRARERNMNAFCGCAMADNIFPGR